MPKRQAASSEGETAARPGNPAERAGAAIGHRDAPEPAGRELADRDSGTEQRGSAGSTSMDRKA
jgi:hypothetical protein